jgi:hypothetical protein
VALFQEAVFDFGQRVCQGGMTLATFWYERELGVLIVVELFFEIGGVLGRLVAGDVLLPVGQPFAEEVVCLVFLFDGEVETIQIMVGIMLLLPLLPLLPLLLLLLLVLIFEADAHFQSSLTLVVCCLVEHLLLLVGVHVDE